MLPNTEPQVRGVTLGLLIRKLFARGVESTLLNTEPLARVVASLLPSY